jgi:hypothetical protein
MSDLLRPVERSMTPEFARNLVAAKADKSVQSRVAVLARKCNDGTLTEAEQDEYREYVTAGSMIAYLQAQARLLLKQVES